MCQSIDNKNQHLLIYRLTILMLIIHTKYDVSHSYENRVNYNNLYT